jgi:hypothetical protein
MGRQLKETWNALCEAYEVYHIHLDLESFNRTTQKNRICATPLALNCQANIPAETSAKSLGNKARL